MLERSISFGSLVESKSASVLALRQNNYRELFAFVLIVVTDFVSKFHPNLSGLTNEIAADLIETRDCWKAEDFIHFFKFIRQRQDLPELKIYGQMNYEKLTAMLLVYEDHRAQALEQFHAQCKGNHSAENKSFDDLTKQLAERIASKTYEKKDEVLGKEYEKTGAEMEKKRMQPNYKPPVPITPDETYFKKSA